MIAEKKQQLARTFLSVLSHPDPEVIKSTAVEDVIWSFPGASPISGEVQGVDGIMRRAQTIASWGAALPDRRRPEMFRTSRRRVRSAHGL